MQDKHDGHKRWLKADPEQKKIWHLENRIKAAKLRGDPALAEQLAKELEAIKD